MKTTLNAKELRASMPEVVEQVRRGGRFTVIYRSRPAFRIVPVDDALQAVTPLEEDPLFRAPPVGRSRDGASADQHDAVLYQP